MSALPKYDCDLHTNFKPSCEDIHKLIDASVQELMGCELPDAILIRAYDLINQSEISFREAHNFAHLVVHYYYENGNDVAQFMLAEPYQKGIDECLITE